jgi:hypothetical protein
VAVGASPRNAQNYFYGVVVPVSGGTAGPAQLVRGAINLDGVACPQANTCVAVGSSLSAGVLVPIVDGIAGKATVVPGTGSLNAIGCASAASCWATGSDKSYTHLVVVSINGSSYTVHTFRSLSPAGGESGGPPLFCTPQKTCLALATENQYRGPGAVISLANGKIVNVKALPGSASLAGLACAGLSSCVATGYGRSGAVVVPIVNGNPGTVHSLSAVGYIGSVACRGAGTCFGFGNEGPRSVVIAISHGKPGAVAASPIYANGDWCGTSGCVAVGEAGTYPHTVGVLFPFS